MVLMLLIGRVTLAEPIRMDVQTDIGHIVKMLAANEPDDFANLTFGIIAGQARKGLRVDLLILCQLRHIVQRSAPRSLARTSSSTARTRKAL
jgi:hypothetical protein